MREDLPERLLHRLFAIALDGLAIPWYMDAMDDVCYRDMPKAWLSGCQPLYKKGDQLVEMYLHDYDDWEICNEVQPACKSAKMFESLGAVKAR